MSLGITTIDLYLTGQCNLKCGYCYGEDDTKPHMTKETLDACMDFAEQAGMTAVELCGGEPLLSPLFPYAVEEIRKRSWNIILRTNGLLIDQYLDLIADNCEWVGISMDGMQAVNARMRPARGLISVQDQFAQPMDSIGKLKEKNGKIKILLASVATAENYEDLVDLKNYIVAQALPIDKWKIYQFVTDKFRSVENESRFHLDRDQFDQVVDEIPALLPNGTAVIHQRSDHEGAGGNCLLVHQSGRIQILGKEYGVIGQDDTETICRKLASSHLVASIRENKGLTYEE